MAVVLIRASNLPVLMMISLYERHQYSDTGLLEALGDYAERYMGALPRKLKTASTLEIAEPRRQLIPSRVRQFRVETRL